MPKHGEDAQPDMLRDKDVLEVFCLHLDKNGMLQIPVLVLIPFVAVNSVLLRCWGVYSTPDFASFVCEHGAHKFLCYRWLACVVEARPIDMRHEMK